MVSDGHNAKCISPTHILNAAKSVAVGTGFWMVTVRGLSGALAIALKLDAYSPPWLGQQSILNDQDR